MLAVITGASSGIGLSLAEEFASRGYDLVIVSSHPDIADAAAGLRRHHVNVHPYDIDLASEKGVNQLYGILTSMPVDVLALNAGTTVYGDFMRETSVDDQLKLIDLNIRGVVQLSRLVVPSMIARGSGRVLITSSVAALTPGPLYATYAASKSFLFSFSEALSNELSDTGVTVTCLMPGPTDTQIFKKTGMSQSHVAHGPKADPAHVARQAVDALLSGRDHVVGGSWFTKLEAFGAPFLPAKWTASVHRWMTSSSGSSSGSSPSEKSRP